MQQKKKELKSCMKRLNELHREIQKRKKQQKLLNCLEQLQQLQAEVEKREKVSSGVSHHPVWESEHLPHPVKLKEYIIRFADLEPCARELLEDALNARCNAYVPYSQFKVGAAFRTTRGRIFSGCNIENAAYTPGCCAERTALAKGISEGCRLYEAGAVVAYHKQGYVTPCGVCRQFIREFAKSDIALYVAQAPELSTQLPSFNDDDEILVTSIYNLLPHSFSIAQ